MLESNMYTKYSETFSGEDQMSHFVFQPIFYLAIYNTK